ncbi:GNAT family N-acetyltransferase [Pelagibius sp. Alg239-R121]|uniref:GNAT family N-acetyltransferase n=1 Tax=Pelagibius sp. Alg239-R121 TaxID=2993448 RepID=UPI0024A79A45|nr:GNAT family N-acetyltransferase [Pelagibius sp. Alg239-R121]
MVPSQEYRRRKGVRIRAARADEAEHLCEVEFLAGARFRSIGMAKISERSPSQPSVFTAAAQHQRLLVADIMVKDQVLEEAVGFAAFGTLDGHPHLLELDVIPGYAGQRIGASLIDAVAKVAIQKRQGSWLTLTTFRDVPWNAPYYRRLGFKAVSPETLGPELAQCLARERIRLPPEVYGPRIAMRRALA